MLLALRSPKGLSGHHIRWPGWSLNVPGPDALFNRRSNPQAGPQRSQRLWMLEGPPCHSSVDQDRPERCRQLPAQPGRHDGAAGPPGRAITVLGRSVGDPYANIGSSAPRRTAYHIDGLSFGLYKLLTLPHAKLATRRRVPTPRFTPAPERANQRSPVAQSSTVLAGRGSGRAC
jgi:hypothetical protein